MFGPCANQTRPAYLLAKCLAAIVSIVRVAKQAGHWCNAHRMRVEGNAVSSEQ